MLREHTFVGLWNKATIIHNFQAQRDRRLLFGRQRGRGSLQRKTGVLRAQSRVVEGKLIERRSLSMSQLRPSARVGRRGNWGQGQNNTRVHVIAPPSCTKRPLRSFS